MFLLKLALSNLVIISCVLVGRRFPSLGGLIATMPLTSLVVLFWLRSEEGGTRAAGIQYVRGVLWGILPTVAFFAVVYLLLRRGSGLPLALGVGGGAWLAGALLHQNFLR